MEKAGTGSGTVTSNLGGLTCGPTCNVATTTLAPNAQVTLSVDSASGSMFAGWSGHADCADGVVTLSGARTCRATFTTSTAPTVRLTVTKSGTGGGWVVTDGGELACGSTCAVDYPAAKDVKLNATAGSGSTFAGWRGCSGSTDRRITVTLATHETCEAVFTATSSGGDDAQEPTDAPPAPSSAVAPIGAQEYYHPDALGSIRAATDEGGAVVRRHEYLPFGEEWQGPTGATTVRFTGKELDDDLGLYYFGARYQRAEIGRFTTVDPAQTIAENLVDPQRWNRYAYVRNNPLKFVDPDGRDALWVTYPGSRLVDVIIPVNITGKGATPELIAAIERRVDNLNTGNPEVRILLVVTDSPIAGVHNVLTLKEGPWLNKGQGCEAGGCANKIGGRKGYVDTESGDVVGVATHEILHFAGAPEGYKEDKDANGRRVTPPAEGYTRRDIMAARSGTRLTPRDVDQIKANKTTRACSAGKDGKPVCK